VQYVEMLDELGQFLEGAERSRPAAAFEIGDVGRASAGEERHRAELEQKIAAAVARQRWN
jgi:hypothetical protein